MKHLPLLSAMAVSFTLLACDNHKRAVADDVPPPSPSDTPTERIETVPLFGGNGKADSVFFSIERTPCFGECKVYRIEVFRSGFATYNGRKNMEKEGRHTGWVDQATMTALLAKADEVHFFDMNDIYDAEVTDLPSTWVRLVARGHDKKVLGRVGTPPGFKALVAFTEEQLLPLPWRPIVAEP